MSNLNRDKTLALAALFQSATLADALAWEALSGRGQIVRKTRGAQSHEIE